MYVSAIIAAGGRGSRFGGGTPKQLISLVGRPVLEWAVEAFLQSSAVDEVIVALPAELAASPPAFLSPRSKPIAVVAGGGRRQDSVANAVAAVHASADIVVIHDAARPLVTPDLIRRTVDAAAEAGAAIAAVGARDTVKRAQSGVITATIPREEIYLAQTPQAFRVEILRAALAFDGGDATDEAALVERAGHAVRLVEGDARNLKITTPEDLAMAEHLLGETLPMLRIGNGYDLHRLVPGRPLLLGGVDIPFERGLEGHSDADAVCHAVTDAILGAASAGDIGRHFPDTDPAWKGANSIDLLRRAVAVVAASGYRVVNVDVVVIAQQPKLTPFIPAMVASVANALGVAGSRVSIKGKTNEGVDSMGTGASIAVHAVALLQGKWGRESFKEDSL